MSEFPFVTVVMPIRNEGEFIIRSLGAVLAQEYPSERMEILVADGMSTDCTRDVVKALQAKRPLLLLIDNPGGIVSTGLNAALAQASGEIVVRVDGHTIIDPDYVKTCVNALQQTGASNVGGRMDPVGSSSFGRAVALATSSPFGVGGARFHYSDRAEFVDTVYMGAWRRDVFQRVGLFDEELVRNQDDEFNYRLRSQGGRILLSPAIKSLYFNRSTMGSLWRQYYQYGYWKVRVLQKHPRQMQARQFAPPVFALSLLITAMSAPLSPISAIAFGIEAALYILSNLAASLVAGRKSLQSLMLLPATFAVLHFSYGFGFMAGLIKFRDRWGASGRPPSELPGQETNRGLAAIEN